MISSLSISEDFIIKDEIRFFYNGKLRCHTKIRSIFIKADTRNYHLILPDVRLFSVAREGLLW
jgi:hypothetical protein